MKIQILVPQYNETEEIVAPLLKSLELQQHVDVQNDIGVIIVNDGSDTHLSNEFLEQFPYSINYIIKDKHEGVSAARNTALDAATADYVMFCDADDMFFNMCGLYVIFREMKGTGFNALSSVFVEETKDQETGELVYINREGDSTFVHGKVYRRSFLRENNIRWNDSLTIHEDSYFNCLAQKVAEEIKYCQQPFYLWKWRDTSVCRHDPKYILKTYNNMLESNTALVKELIRRGKRQDGQFYATAMIYDAYFTMNKDEWLNQENQKYREATELRFRDYWFEFRDLFEAVPKQHRAQIVMGIKNRFYAEGLLMESITFDDWIAHIMDLRE